MGREASVNKEELISVPRAAKMLGLSIPYTQRLIRTGKIRGEKIEGSWYASEEALRSYLAMRERRGRT